MSRQLTIDQALALAADHHRAGRLRDAEAIYRQILASQPNHPQALHRLGMIALHAGRADIAAQLIERAIAIHPTDPVFHCDLGHALAMLGRLDESIAAIRQALSLNPDYAHAWSNLGNALQSAGRLDDAIDAYRQAIAHNPDFADAFCNLGVALRAQGKLDEAMAAYRQTLALAPNHELAHYNLGLGLLLQGDYEQGWSHHEWRWKVPELNLRRQQFSQPEWDGSDLRGKTIYLQAEQGFGDTIQFVRYAPLLAERGAKVILGCPSPLLRLMRSLEPEVTLLTDGDALPEFDVHASLMSLPGLMNTTVNTIPANIPYLRADPGLSAQWRGRFTGDGLKVGICWAGLPTHRNDRNRSLPPNALTSLVEVEGISFVSLQKGPAANPGVDMLDFSNDLNDFADTAALIDNLDIVLSVDTAVAHLAGAMGKQTLLLLPFMPDWRWLLARDDSPWYPTLRLFRQPAIGDWSSPIHAVLEQLKKARTSDRSR